jgi:hypothetical protein
MILTDGPYGCPLVGFDRLHEAQVMFVRSSLPGLGVKDLVMNIYILESCVLELALLKLGVARRGFGIDLVCHVEDHRVYVYSSVVTSSVHSGLALSVPIDQLGEWKVIKKIRGLQCVLSCTNVIKTSSQVFENCCQMAVRPASPINLEARDRSRPCSPRMLQYQ